MVQAQGESDIKYLIYLISAPSETSGLDKDMARNRPRASWTPLDTAPHHSILISKTKHREGSVP